MIEGVRRFAYGAAENYAIELQAVSLKLLGRGA